MPSSHFSESKNIAAEATENIRHSADAHYWTTAVFKFLHSPVWRNTLWHLFAISEFICFGIMQMPPVISSCNWGVRFLLITQSSRGRCHQFFLFGRRKKMCAPLYATHPTAKASPSSACWFPHKKLLNLSRTTNKVFIFDGACCL